MGSRMENADPKKNHGSRRIIFGFPLIGLVLTVIWIVYETITFEISAGGSDPAVIQKNIGYTLIPFGVGIIAGLFQTCIKMKRKAEQASGGSRDNRRD